MKDHHSILRNLSNQDAPALKVVFCASFICRLKGLMFTSSISTEAGLLLVEQTESKINAAIHMFFMHYDIAVVWLDKDFRVVDVKIARKWQPYYAPAAPARFTLETNVLNFPYYQIGDHLQVSDA